MALGRHGFPWVTNRNRLAPQRVARLRFRVEKTVSFGDFNDPLAAPHSASLSSPHPSSSTMKTPPQRPSMGFSWRFLLCTLCAPAVRVQCRCTAPHFSRRRPQAARPEARPAFMMVSAMKALPPWREQPRKPAAYRVRSAKVPARPGEWLRPLPSRSNGLPDDSHSRIDDSAARTAIGEWSLQGGKTRFARKRKRSSISLLR